ncbi:MAG TPA: M1 family metallopeptidase, partial [Kofleriaceae bacterium]|nr:M1 family metallopeptidase [Kofleriaceae bacterium]
MQSIRAVLVLSLVACGGGGKAAAPVEPTPAPPVTPPNPQPPTPAADPAAPALRLPDGAAPRLYLLEVHLDPGKDTFTGTVRIDVQFKQAADHVWLHGGALTVDGAVLKSAAGEIIPARRLATSTDDFLGIGFGKQVPAGNHWLEIAFTGKVADNDYAGVFRQKDGDNAYLFTQFESTSARKAFPCFDEPRFKVPWTVSLHVPDGMKAFTNTPLKLETPGKGAGERTLTFETTPPLPSYLVAFAVGPFDVVDAGVAGRNRTPVRIIVPKGKAARAAFAARSVGQIQTVLEDYFDIAYPFAKIDHIAVPSFFGAMENPGLITYREEILLADPGAEPIGWQKGHAGTVAHELAHMWFGDLVTLAWWDDTWLNESFATWASLHAVDAWRPQWQAMLDAAGERGKVFAADSLITARRVRNPIASPDDIASAFDAITYGKGAAVLWMFERWIGPDKFRDGIRAYLKEHAGGTTVGADFLAAIGKVSQPEAPAAFSSFIDQPGVPLVTVGLSCAPGGKPAVTLAQERYLPTGSPGQDADKSPVPQRWQVPMCLRYATGKGSAVQCTLFKDAEATIELDQATSCPAWVVGNADASGYYRVEYKGGMLGKLVAARGLSVLERLGLADDLIAMLDSGRAGTGEVMNLAGALARDPSPRVLAGAATVVDGIDDFLVADELRPNFARFVRKTFSKPAARLGFAPRKGEPEDVTAARRPLLELVAWSSS